MAQMRILFAYLLLLVRDVHGNNAPVCTPDFALVQIAEDATVTSPVASPICADTDLGADGDISYAITSGNDDGKFQLNTASGDVTLAASLDYETLENYTIIIRVYDGGTPALETTFYIYVHVTPINEFAPVISNPSISVRRLPESSLGNVIATVSATDDDKGFDGDLRYFITAGDDDGQFHVDQYSGEIYPVQPLDYEKKTSYSLTVEVSDISGTSPKTSTATIDITLKNENEFYPTCQTFFVATMKEDSADNRRHGVLQSIRPTCSDPDDDGRRRYPFLFSLQFMNDYTKFNMHPFGNFRLAGPIDPDVEKSVYFQTVFIREFGVNPRLTSTMAVLITIEGVDDNPTVWNNTDIQIVLSEDEAPGASRILQLEAEDGDPPDTEEGRVWYGLESQTNPDQFFVSHIGEIYLIKPLDRETNDEVILDVYAYTKNKDYLKVRATVTVKISDVNDNAPQFTQPWYVVTATEGQTYDPVPLTTVKATDQDLGVSATIAYSIIDGDPLGQFVVDSTTGEITVPTSLDFESQDLYTLTVMAEDGGPNPLNETVLLVVRVNPVNEFDPFVNNGLEGSISEGAPSGTPVLRINASDADSGVDGQIAYFGEEDIFPFALDKDTGELTVIGTLDRETTPVHYIGIIVSDMSETAPRSITATATVTVLDENDNSPVCNAVIHAELSVLDGAGTDVVQISCNDADIGTNAEFTYTILSGNDLGDFTIDANGKIVSLTSPSLDYYSLQIVVEDKGSQALNTSLEVVISVAVYPLVSNLPEVLNVPENTSMATVLHVINSTSSGVVSYSIASGNDDRYFALGKSSGRLYLAKQLDKETIDRFELAVDITDVRSGLATTGNLTLLVEDVNDNAPRFDSGFYNIRISESLSPATEIMDFDVTDLDIDPENRQVSFVIESGNEEGKFAIDADGKLTLAGGLDFETTPLYHLIISASDNVTFGSLSASTTVNIQIVNTDEFPTTFNFTGGGNSTSLPEDFPLGGVLFQVQANDLDGDSIQYGFVSADNSTFQIDSISGKIYLIKSLDRESTDSHILVLSAQNPSGSSSTVSIAIQVTDVNDNDPKFSSPVYAVSVLESEPPGTGVLNLTCADLDIGINADIRYNIVGGNEDSKFKLVGDQLLTDRTFDYYAKSSYPLVIEAVDQGTPPHSATTVVTVKILQDTTPPKFFPNTEGIIVAENTKPGTQVYDTDATALGAEEYSNGTLRYRIVSGDNKFAIVEDSGKVFLADFVDAENTQSYYEIVIESFTTMDPSLTDAFQLNISISDVNDNPPVFVNSQYSAVVADGSTAGLPVLAVTALDADSGINAQVTYSLKGIGSSDFIIHPTSGQLDVATTIDYSSTARYIFTVVATDSGTPALTSETIIIITVESDSNNPPYFTQGSLATSVPEDVANGTAIYKVVAIDQDPGVNGDLTYAIIGGNIGGLFSVNQQDGTVSIASDLDRESTDSVTLEILCSDGGSPSLSARIFLDISILDANDNDPVFTNSLYSFIVSKDVNKGYQVGVVSASDLDQDYNSIITYTILSGNDANLFSLDPYFGSVATNADLAASSGVYTLILRATDHGQSPRAGTATLKITVTDTPNYNFNVTENAAGITVGTITELGSVKYSIVAGDALAEFILNDGTGELTTATPLDREFISGYSLTVHVEDTANPSSWYNLLVKVTVLDENDNGPAFSQPSYAVDILEGSPVDFSVFSLPVTDTDVHENADITFVILDSESDAAFKISQLTKEILVKVPPVFADRAFYDVTVRATDGGAPARSGDTTVRVNIIEPEKIETNATVGGGSMFLSLECSHTDTSGLILSTLSVDMFGFDPTDVASVEYITFQEAYSPFIVGASSGVIKVSNDALILQNSKYIFWVVSMVLFNDGSEEARQGMVRVDTFDPVSNVIQINLDIPLSDLSSSGEPETIKASLKSLLAAGRIGIWKMEDGTGPSSRRRLLAQGDSSIFVYAVQPPDTNTLADLTSTKQFLSANDLLALYQTTSDGTPVTVLTSGNSSVVSVFGLTEEPEVEAAWHETSNGIAVIAIICTFIVLLIAALAIYFACTRSRKRKRQLDSSDKHALDNMDDDSMVKTLYQSSQSPPPPYQSRPGTRTEAIRVRVIDGVRYDGQAIDPDTGMRYYFSSKTGQTHGISGYINDEAAVNGHHKLFSSRKSSSAVRSSCSDLGSIDSFQSTEITLTPCVTEDVQSERVVRNTLPAGLRVRSSNTSIGSDVDGGAFSVPPGSPSFPRGK